MKVLVIGAGNMGLTYAEGMADSVYLNRRKLMVYDISVEVRQQLVATGNYEVIDDLTANIGKADIVFIAVKPYHSEELFETIKPHVRNEQLFISLMAGVKIETIQAQLGVAKVVRTMPNLPAKVGKGVTSFTCSPAISRIEFIMVRNLLDTAGESIHVADETFIDKSTGISGSGPAYVFYFMQSMLEAAKKMGFSDNDSKVLVSSTFEGAVALFNENDLSPETWIDRVASKGGTTRAALDSMEDNNVKELIKEAAFAAFERAVELGE